MEALNDSAKVGLRLIIVEKKGICKICGKETNYKINGDADYICNSESCIRKYIDNMLKKNMDEALDKYGRDW